MADRPAAEVAVDEALVARLLTDQHPDLADQPLRLAASGWDNVIVRLGEDLAVRAPRRAAAAELIRHEQRWLPVLAPRLPVDTPVPVRHGGPTPYFPWAWSVTRWFPGTTAAVLAAGERHALAEPLAAFVNALHRPAPADAPHNPVRGVPLRGRHDAVRERLGSGLVPEADRVLTLWEDLRHAPVWTAPPLWLHGDLHPANMLVHDGALVAVIDFGDLTAGDPATDLATAWLTFDAPGRASFARALAGAYDEATWRRARGWALSLATALLAHSDDVPLLRAVGEHTIREVLGG
ncbi:aminoglycoside phosphotransferase family protein [Georgenia yuyongxinii]|uniref:Aminoglycoside phosphotransferase family protein n=1 Tax=Georgenia yuyongxinii TaxID=2589797 RepID=A0A552WSC1_9MICO|nr:aminoglycoside phosphotransferase family protein [Georgenia yuyongxinii]TRW45731.1 aminoglycoside phosphotransferase family protein [Georgenia yuyongxinii]